MITYSLQTLTSTVRLPFHVVSDTKGGTYLANNTLIIDAVNDEPVRTAGNVGTLFLVEDEPLTSLGLEDLTYSVGGGADESAIVNNVAHKY